MIILSYFAGFFTTLIGVVLGSVISRPGKSEEE